MQSHRFNHSGSFFFFFTVDSITNQGVRRWVSLVVARHVRQRSYSGKAVSHGDGPAVAGRRSRWSGTKRDSFVLQRLDSGGLRCCVRGGA